MRAPVLILLSLAVSICGESIVVAQRPSAPSPGGFGGGGGRPGGGGGGYRPSAPSPGVNRPSPGGGYSPPNPNGGGGLFSGNNRYDPSRPNPSAPGRPYVPGTPSPWKVANPLGGQSRILPSTGRVDLSHAPAPTRGPMSQSANQARFLARSGNTAELTNHFNQVSQGGKNLGAMYEAVTAMHGVVNPTTQQFRVSTLNLARAEIAQGVKNPMPWVVIAQMSLQDNNSQQFNEATAKLAQQYPQSEYTPFFQGVQHLQNRDYAAAQASLEQARAMGISEESIAELLKTAIDNQKWIWEYATVMLILVAAWLLGLALLYVVGRRFSQRTLARVGAPLDAVSAGDRRLRKWYRRVINIAGIYYYVSLPMLVIVSLALPLALGYAVLMVPYLNLFLVAVVFVLGIGGILTAVSGIRTAFLRVPDGDDGRLVAAGELPALWALTRETAEQVGTRPVDEIRLTVGAELAVYEKGSYLERLRDRGRRVLILGVGALPGLKLDSLKAILAHEYGHFIHRDTAGGDVALRVYQAMNNFAIAVVTRGKIRWWDVSVRFLKVFHRIFRRLTFGASRLQEIYADRMAVANYGAAAFNAGLTHVIRRSLEMEWAVNKTLDEVVRTGRPAVHFYRSAPLPDLSERQDIETVLAEIIARPTDVDDSHPSPSERFRLASELDPSAKVVAEEFAMTLVEDDPLLAAELNKTVDDRIRERAAEILRNYKQGIEVLTDILQQEDTPDARFERARIFMEKGDYAACVGDLNEVLKHAPDAVGILYMRAQAYEKMRMYAEAAAEFDRISKLMEKKRSKYGIAPADTADNDADRNQVLLKAAQCLASAERHQESAEAFGLVLEKAPKSLPALIGRGRSAVRLKSAEKALADFNAAVTHWPTSAEPLLERAELYARCGRAELAAADRRAAAVIDRRVAAERAGRGKPAESPEKKPAPTQPVVATSAEAGGR